MRLIFFYKYADNLKFSLFNFIEAPWAYLKWWNYWDKGSRDIFRDRNKFENQNEVEHIRQRNPFILSARAHHTSLSWRSRLIKATFGWESNILGDTKLLRQDGALVWEESL